MVLEQEHDLLESNNCCLERILFSNHTIAGKIKILKTASDLIYSVTSKAMVASQLHKQVFDVAHIHNFFPLLTPSIYDACIEAGVPVVQTLHNYRTICPGALLMRDQRICETCITSTPYHGALHMCYRNSFPASLVVARMVAYHRKKKTWQQKVNRFIALTEFARNKFIQGGFPSEKIAVKPNFVKDPITPEKLNTGHREKALFVGRLSPEKGIDTLIQAWRHIDYPLEIAGTGPLFDKLKRNASDNIIFSGHVPKEEIMEKMLTSSFLIMPSTWYEGFPVVIVESFACGLPILASRLGSMAEIIQDEVTGMHFNPGDVEDLVRKIKLLISSPEKLSQMGANARAEYERKYTPEKNYELLMNIYNSAIKDRKENGYAR